MKINFKLKKKNIQYIGFSVIIIGLIFVMYSFFSYQFNEYETIEGMSNKDKDETRPFKIEQKRLNAKKKKEDEFDGEDQYKLNKLNAKDKSEKEKEIDDVKHTKALNGDVRVKINSINDNIDILKDDIAFAKNKNLYMKYLSKSREEKLLEKMQDELKYVNNKSEREPFKSWTTEELGDLETLLATDQVRPASEVGSGSFI